MRVRLKGIHKVRAKGVDYYYAWRGGPRLVGAPGSPEFIASYTAAHASHREPPKDKFHSIIIAYKSSPEFAGLRPSTQRDYRRHIAAIEVAFGDLPLAALEDARVNCDLLQWRDSFAASPRTADYVWAVLQAVLRWGRDHGLTTYRPPDRVSQLYHVDRSDMIWSEADIAKFLAVASEPLQRALILAIESGQRQGDLLTLPWSAYDGAWIGCASRRQVDASMSPSPRRCAAFSTARRASGPSY